MRSIAWVWSLASLAALGASACTPALNWREVHADDGAVRLLLPCKPDRAARTVRLAGAELVMTLRACSAGGTTWALAEADLVDPTRSAAALAELATASRANLNAGPARAWPLLVPGATPHPGSARQAFSGRLPDGSAAQVQLAVFIKGTRVYQATCVGAAPPVDAIETFFGSLRAGE